MSSKDLAIDPERYFHLVLMEAEKIFLQELSHRPFRDHFSCNLLHKVACDTYRMEEPNAPAGPILLFADKILEIWNSWYKPPTTFTCWLRAQDSHFDIVRKNALRVRMFRALVSNNEEDIRNLRREIAHNYLASIR